jgi:DNA ligase 1
VGTRIGTRLAAKVGLRGGGKLLPVIGEALMVYDAGSETYRLVKERRRGKKRGLGESAARVAGAAFISGEGVDWVEGKLRKRNPSVSIKAVGGKYCVFLNGKDTGKWASTESKAKEIAARFGSVAPPPPVAPRRVAAPPPPPPPPPAPDCSWCGAECDRPFPNARGEVFCSPAHRSASNRALSRLVAAEPAPRRAAPEPRPAPPALRVSGRVGSMPSEVMLAKTHKGEDPTGWWMSEKLDGVRAYWTGTALFTRNGNPIAAPRWFTAALPKMALDGELIIGRGQFQKTVSAVRKQVPVEAEWRRLRFHVFDAPMQPGGCEKRWREMAAAVRGIPHVEALEQVACASPRALEKRHAEIAKLGGEGVMLRKPGSAYEHRRSGSLLKVKSFMDAEAKITGHVPGEGKHAGRLGAYEAVLVKGTKTRFRIGTGMSDAERERPLRVGTVVTVKFQELTDAGVPRFPSLVGARDYE